MTKNLSCLFLIALMALLSACGSTPRSTYYKLTADAAAVTGNTGPSIGVGPIQTPDYLNNREMVINESAHRLTLRDFDRWAEPLDSGIGRIVAVNLSGLLETQRVRVFPWRRDAVPELAVRISVVMLSAQDSEARLVAEWTLTNPQQSKTLEQRITQYRASIPDTEPETIAKAYSTLLLELSEDISAAIEGHHEG